MTYQEDRMRAWKLVVVLSMFMALLATSPALARSSAPDVSAKPLAVPLGSCMLHAYAPKWYSDGNAYAVGEITCSANHHLQLKVCAQHWGNNGAEAPIHCHTVAVFYGSGYQSGSYGWSPDAPPTYWRTWVWGYVDGVTAYYQSAWVLMG